MVGLGLNNKETEDEGVRQEGRLEIEQSKGSSQIQIHQSGRDSTGEGRKSVLAFLYITASED